jgi:hypothetical protein
VFVIGDWPSEAHATPFDDPARLGEIPGGFGGGLWTDRTDRTDRTGWAVKARLW